MPAKRTPRQYWTPKSLQVIGQMWRRLRRIERWLRRNNWGTIIDGQQRRYFELKTNLAAGGTATAYLRTGSTLTTDTSTTFTVEDDIGDRTGTGRDNVGSGEHGAYGKAELRFGKWWIYDLECP